MSVDRKEIDLIIRAALQGGKTLDGVTKSISDIEKALDLQTAAAKRGESSIDQLKATLESLKRAQDQLKDQAGLIGQFQRLSVQVAESAEKTNKAATAFAAYKEKLDKAGTATDYQSARLIKLANASERSQVSLAKQRTDQEGLSATLRDAGIEMDKLGESETRVRQAAAQLGVTINRTQQAISTYAEDVQKARKEEQLLAEQNAFDQKLVDAAKLNKAGEYVRMYTNALNERDAAEQKLKVNAALRNTADAAVATARGYKTLGTAAAPSQATGLRSAIAGIIDPSEQARSTLTGVEAEVQKVGAAITAINGPISGYRDQVQQLAAAQKAIGQQASLVDSFNRQVAAVRQARSEFSTARASVLQYAEAMRNSSGENEQLSASLRSAQAALASAQKTLRDQIGTAREMRSAMRDAGLATNDLAGTQARLTAAAHSSTESLRDLKVAHDKYGDATRNSSQGHELFNNSGRTTLSLLQRIRGEVLSLMAAYVGVYGAIQGANGAIEAFNTKQAIQNSLSISVGNDNAKIAEEYKYIREQADRVGVSFESAARGYAKFSASAKLSGRDSKEIRYIFETFMEVGRVASLTKDELDGVFKALEQMISKGTIQAEELRGQLGDRLFGAFAMAAKALKSQFPDLNKAMKDGLVTSDQLIKIAEKYRETVGPRLGEATHSLIANQARLNSAVFDFKVLIAEQGFADEYGKLVKTLGEFFQSNDGTKFARDLSDGFSMVVQSLRWMVENLETVKAVMTTVFGLYASKLILGIGAGAVSAVTSLRLLNASLTTTTTLAGFLMKGFMLVNSFFVGWEIGTVLRDKFVEVRLAVVALVVGLETLWTRLKYSTAIAWAEWPNIILDALSAVGNVATRAIRELLGVFSMSARALGKNDLADSIDRALKTLEFRTNRIGSSSAKLRQQMARDLEQIRKIGNEMADEAINPGSTRKSKPGVSPTDKPEPGNTPTKIDEKAAAKRLKLKEEIEAELKAIDTKIERQEKDSLESRLNALDDTYYRLVQKIKKLGGPEAKLFTTQLTLDVEALKGQETRKFNDALLKEQTDLQRKLEQVDAAAGRAAKTDMDKRLEAVQQSHEQTYRDIETFRKKLSENGRDTTPADLMKDRLDGGVKQLQNIERLKYYEDSVNAILEERKAKLDTIAVQEKTGLITAIQARERASQVVAETQPKIEALTKAGLDYVDVMMQAAEAAGLNTAALETLKSKLIEGRESAKGIKTEFLSAAQVNEMLASGAAKGFQTMAEAVGGAIRGVNSWKDAISATRNAFLNFAADFLMQIAQMILKQTLLNALQSATAGSTSGVGGIISTAVNAMMHHTGGIVGSGGTPRAAKLEWFANAPRYHNGGIPGLAPDEYAAILKKNEEVLTTADPRNVLNGGMTAGAAAASQNLKIINMIDSGSVVSEGLSSQQGEKAFFNFIRANRTGLKQILT